MIVVSHYFYLQAEEKRLGKVCKLVISESKLMFQIQEVERLQRQLQTTTDGKIRKQLQDDIYLTEAKKELANSKAVR